MFAMLNAPNLVQTGPPASLLAGGGVPRDEETVLEAAVCMAAAGSVSLRHDLPSLSGSHCRIGGTLEWQSSRDAHSFTFHVETHRRRASSAELLEQASRSKVCAACPHRLYCACDTI